jgi:GNAT superfamily N-acetyltransferase
MMIRTLTVAERKGVSSFYLALTADDRRKRFCSTLSDAAIVGYVDGLDFVRHIVLGAFNERAGLIGLAELAPGAEEREMAFAVRADQRGRCIGTALMNELLLRARACGSKRVLVIFLADNVPMRRLAAKSGMRFKTEGSEACAWLRLEAPGADAQQTAAAGQCIAQTMS